MPSKLSSHCRADVVELCAIRLQSWYQVWSLSTLSVQSKPDVLSMLGVFVGVALHAQEHTVLTHLHYFVLSSTAFALFEIQAVKKTGAV